MKMNKRVYIKGGSWMYPFGSCRSANCGDVVKHDDDTDLGFRIVRIKKFTERNQ